MALDYPSPGELTLFTRTRGLNCETHHLWCGRTESSSFIFASFGYSRFMDTHSDRQIPVHIRPEGVTDDEVKAAGVLSNDP